jgi:hypothetical protein
MQHQRDLTALSHIKDPTALSNHAGHTCRIILLKVSAGHQRLQKTAHKAQRRDCARITCIMLSTRNNLVSTIEHYAVAACVKWQMSLRPAFSDAHEQR